MATKQNKNALIKCEHCGEYYSVTYKECPFCDEFDLEGEEQGSSPSRRRSGGRRLVSNKRGGGYGSGWTSGRILVTVGSVGVIIAAAVIVFSFLKPLIDRGNIDVPSPSELVTDSPSPSAPSPSTSLPAEPGPSDVVEPTPSDSPSPSPSPSVPAGQTATGFTLSHSDFSFSNQYHTPITIKVTFYPAGSTGTITWTSSDPDVATVDANGKVSPGTKQGQTTVTATMAGGAAQTCIVRSTVTGGTVSSPSPSPSPSASASFTLSREDFTLSRRGETYQIKVSGTDRTPTWSSSNTSVATVSSNGTVTAVGSGTCTVTAKLGSTTRTCIVRVSY